ncbi:hypothetical protein NQ317_008037, partial [Molorchus minor]
MDTLPRLRFKRGNIKSQLTRLQTYYQGLDLQNLTAANVSQLEYRLNKIESIYDEYNEIQLEIEFILENAEDVDLQTISNESNVRVEFENSYFDLITVIKDTITNFYNRNEIMNNNEQENMSGNNISAKSDSSHKSEAYTHAKVKLPTIKLPTFNGCYDRWLEFRDSFVALVDSNDSISEIQKFYYLRSSLEAEAAHLVASIEVSASNYAIAWGLLKDRFENKKLLVHNYVKTFFDAPVMARESHSELRKLYDTFTKSLRSLKTLGQPTDNWDTLIIHMLTSKFDNVTRRDWESYKLQDELPTMQDINAFLKNKCDILEKLELNKSEKCNKQLDVNSRFKEINKRKLCHNCLHPGHAAHQCKRSGCRKCKRKHNSVLHHDTREHNPPNEHAATTTNVQSAEASTSVAFVGHTINKKDISQVLLSTALVYVKDISGNLHTARVLLDQGSQSHFITDALCNKLALRKFSVDCAITGVGQTRSEAEFETSLTIMSRINDFNINISCVVLPKITQQLPINSFDKSILDLPNKIQLADPEFNISSKIDILLGVSLFYKIMCMRQLQRRNQPVLQKTKFGWVVGGDLCHPRTKNETISCHTIGLRQINESLIKFWEIDNICDTSKGSVSNLDEYCESHFQKTYTRDPTGRFVLGLDNLTQHPRASEVIMNDFYVDDLLSGSNEASELIQLQRDVTSILISGGFELRKWLSNKPELVDNFLLNDNLDSNILQLGENEPNKTLGILWNAQADTIQYAIKNVNLPSKVTKRYIFYYGKKKSRGTNRFQTIYLKKWNAFCTDLPLLNELTIPRHIGILHANNFELHAFADASQIAYGACVYIRYNLPDNSYETKLLCAKSRVAPLKTISLPRLELCGALLLAQLVEKVRTSSTINFSHSYYWSDSKITLCWIRGPPSKWKTFIGNRVSEIQQLTNIEDWHHVSSNNNCADLISRGVNSRQLLQSKLWWHGPSFLEGHNSSWNLNDDFTNESIVVPEMRIITNLVIDDYEDFEIFSRYSSLVKLQRVIAYCYRFIHNSKNKRENRYIGPLT